MRNLGIDVLEPETRVTGYGNKGNWIWRRRHGKQMLRWCQKHIRIEDAFERAWVMQLSFFIPLYFVCKGRPKGNKRYIVAATVSHSNKKQMGDGTSGTRTHGLTIALLFLFQHNFTPIPTAPNLCSLHVFIYIAFSKTHLDAARRTTAAFCYKRSVVRSHVLDYFVDHLDLREQAQSMS